MIKFDKKEMLSFKLLHNSGIASLLRILIDTNNYLIAVFMLECAVFHMYNPAGILPHSP